MISSDHFSKDVLDFLMLLYKHDVKYIIIGGEAVIYYGHARLTGDIDFFYERGPHNIKRLFNALLEFWDNDIPGLKTKNELVEKDIVIQFGVPPNRIDLLNDIGFIKFEDAWAQKMIERTNIQDKYFDIYFISLEHLIENKKSVARPKDQDDLKFLESIKK